MDIPHFCHLKLLPIASFCLVHLRPLDVLHASFLLPVAFEEHHERASQFLELFFMRSSLFLMSNILSGSADIESLVSVDCETIEGCKERGKTNMKLPSTYKRIS